MDLSTPLNNLQCSNCIYHIKGTVTCRAFLGGIPDEILDGEFDHTKQFKDEKILYTPIAKKIKIDVYK